MLQELDPLARQVYGRRLLVVEAREAPPYTEHLRREKGNAGGERSQWCVRREAKKERQGEREGQRQKSRECETENSSIIVRVRGRCERANAGRECARFGHVYAICIVGLKPGLAY